ncbi:MAG: hypothetical protein FIA97_16220 [Methylococcaceae bacterium]|nr:hypothetical protein [Methylococcaceae bacterium]
MSHPDSSARRSASRYFGELRDLISGLPEPYGPADIVRFNLLYQRIYRRLDKSERQRVTELADALAAGMEKQQMQAKIFG